jgi:hypothetical protein
MKDALTEAIGLPELTPAQFERARAKILADSFFYNRCLSVLVLGVAARVAESLHPLEKKRMRTISEAEAAPRGKASWGIEAALQTGEECLRAQCSVCRSDVRFTAPKPWSEEKVLHEGTNNQMVQTIWHDPTRADVKYQIEHLHWTHCGHTEKCPPELAMIWEEKLYARIRRS